MIIYINIDRYMIKGEDSATGADNTYTNLTLKVADQSDNIAITKAHTFNITGGKDTSGSSFDSGKSDGSAVIDLSKSTLNLQAGDSAKAADVVLKVGATQAVDVKLDTLNVTKGTLEVVKGSISASNITIGKAEAKAPQAIVNVSGTVGAAGNTVKIIDGGLVESKAEGAKLLGNVIVSGGEIKSGKSTNLTISDRLDLQSGKLNIVEGKVILGNGGTFADKSIVHSGTLVVKGATPVQLTGKFSGAAADTAVLELTDGAVSMDMDTLKTITTGKATLAVTAKKGGTLVLQGDKVDLADGKVILSESGEKTDKINLNTDGTLTIKTTETTFGAADTINAKLAFEVDTLTAGKADGNKLDIKGGTTIKVSKALNVQAADAKNAALNVISGTVVLNGTNGTKGTLTASAVNLKGAAAKEDAKVEITGGDWSVADLAVTSGDVSIINGASLAVTGTMTTAVAANGVVTANASKIDASSAKGLTLAAGGIKLENTATLTLDKNKIVGSNGKIDINKFASGAVNGEANTTITIMDGNKKMQFANGDAYKEFYDSTGFKGTLDVDVTMDAQSGSKPIDQILSGLNNDKIYKNVTATTADGNVSGNKSAGKVEVTSNKDLTLGADTALMLNGAQGGNFVSKTDANGQKVIADVTFGKTGNSLTLKGDGKLGAVSLASSATGSLTIGTHDVASNTTVVAGKDLGAESAALTKIELNNADSSLTVESGSVYATTLNVNEGADLIVKAGKVVSDNGTVKAGASLTVSGDVTYKKATVDGALKANTLTLSDTGSASNIIEHNFASADVDVTKLVLAQYNQLNIGQDNAANPDQSKTGSVYAGTLELNQGKAFIDPSNAVGYSFLAVNNLKAGAVIGDKVAGELNGTVTVGKNAVFGVGFESDQALVDMLAKYTDPKTGALKEFNSALVLNKQVTLTNSTDGITVDPNEDKASATAGNVKFAAGSGLVITDEVYDIDSHGNKTGSAIKFSTAGGNADVTNSKLVLIGDFSGADKSFKLFENAIITGAGTMNISSANGLLTGKLKDDGTAGLEFKRDEAEKKGAFADASAPVRELLFGKLSGDVKGKGLGFDLISDVATGSLSGVVADAAAHAATYAGAQQAAVVSVTTMADAMFGRVGSVGVEAASISATGSQANGGVWLTPMYKSMDSDGFNAQGASYGSDVDAAGVAFGADTVNGNMRFGAVFNIGSGDADGKGNGSGLKDEFDYYGLGIYSAMGFGNFALVGDASLTVISHDVEGHGFKGKADTTAVTMGVTGQYTVATPSVDVTPHLGARFIRLNTDSYDLISAKGVEATTDFDVQNVFSVPLGVTLSKGFVAGGWTLAPSADLSVTFNTGDTDAKSTTTFTGVKALNLNTEVLDEVQYGVTLGLGAQNGAFGTSFGINYTGSSNTDSFGVNAQARYMF